LPAPASDLQLPARRQTVAPWHMTAQRPEGQPRAPIATRKADAGLVEDCIERAQVHALELKRPADPPGKTQALAGSRCHQRRQPARPDNRKISASKRDRKSVGHTGGQIDQRRRRELLDPLKHHGRLVHLKHAWPQLPVGVQGRAGLDEERMKIGSPLAPPELGDPVPTPRLQDCIDTHIKRKLFCRVQTVRGPEGATGKTAGQFKHPGWMPQELTVETPRRRPRLEHRQPGRQCGEIESDDLRPHTPIAGQACRQPRTVWRTNGERAGAGCEVESKRDLQGVRQTGEAKDPVGATNDRRIETAVSAVEAHVAPVPVGNPQTSDAQTRTPTCRKAELQTLQAEARVLDAVDRQSQRAQRRCGHRQGKQHHAQPSPCMAQERTISPGKRPSTDSDHPGRRRCSR